MKALVLALTLALGSSFAYAAEASPVGMWKTIDDSTGKPRGMVELFQEGGELKGRIVKTYPKPGEPENPVCDKCKGDRKGKPVIGMVFLWGLKADDGAWSGGEILDPDNGNVYSAKLEMIDNGQKVKVRGFMGMALLGRTQVWHREK